MIVFKEIKIVKNIVYGLVLERSAKMDNLNGRDFDEKEASHEYE
jgi:hypothetical protein